METIIARPRLRQERIVKEQEYNPMSDPVQVVIFILASDYGITLEELSADCRMKEIKYLRQSVQTVLSREGKVNLCSVGRLTHRTHATILNSIRNVTNDEFIFNKQGASSPLLEVHNKIQKKFLRLYKPIKKRR